MLAASSGCSFAVVTPPPENPDDVEHIECTSNRTAPAIDIALGGAFFVGTLGTIYGANEAAVSETDEMTLVVAVCSVSTVASVVSFISSGYGYRKTSRCRKVLKWVEDQRRRE